MNPSQDQIAAVRAFNRFYTRKLGVLEQHLLDSPYSLTEARVLYELAHRDAPTAKEIGAAIGLDAGYLSRIVQVFHDKALITRKPSPDDRRQYRLALTTKGRLAFGQLNLRSEDDIGRMLNALSANERRDLVQAMARIANLLHPEKPPPSVKLRPPRPGDIGWVVQSHAALYAAEYGFDSSFEALVAEIAAQFLKSFDGARERAWIAEIDGEQVGSVFVVRQADDVAKLRLLLVTPAARGHGLGQRLVNEAIAFARQCGYRRITLWTQSNLFSARRIYEKAGFVLVGSEKHRSFGQDVVDETWELGL
jgi:DNA-binding MarR family transcriptional regulator/GNAT superfamily N-acetyltransferase